jgi:hypothetical protein
MLQQFNSFIQAVPNCEFFKSGLQSQPINLITNLAFLISGWKIYGLLKKHKIINKDLWLLFYGVILLGLGSAIRHYHSSILTLIIDGLPMLGLICLSVYLFAKYLFKLNHWKSLLAIFGYVLLMALILITFNKTVRSALVFSLSSQLIFLPVVLISRKRRRETSGLLVTATVFFLLAAVAFIVDLNYCQKLLFGTHWLWHIFNGLALYYLSKYFILFSKW